MLLTSLFTSVSPSVRLGKITIYLNNVSLLINMRTEQNAPQVLTNQSLGIKEEEYQ